MTMDSEYNRLFKLAVEEKDAGDIVEVIGYFQEAAMLAKSNGTAPGNSIMCLTFLHRIQKMMGRPSEKMMETAYEDCRELAKGGP
jgi:hypothetical protein